MDQVLFWIPIRTGWTPQGIPVYGFGVMLVAALLVGSWVAMRRGQRIGLPGEKVQDLITWVFVLGLIGGRLLYVYWKDTWDRFFVLWDGGLVFYGGAIGGTIGGLIAYYRIIKPLGVSAWQVADVLAPAVAIGLALGRIGCFLNGCCWGHCAAPGQPAVNFPALTAPARDKLVLEHGEQTLTGFAMAEGAKDDRTAGAIEPGSPAERAGLKAGDVITAVNGHEVMSFQELEDVFYRHWPRGEPWLTLQVQRGDQRVDLPRFKPVLLGVYPTQIYESISAFLIFLALLATYPLRKYDGQVMILAMMAYAVHRWVNESLRDDTPAYFGLTLAQWISIGIFAAALMLAGVRHWQLRRGADKPR